MYTRVQYAVLEINGETLDTGQMASLFLEVPGDFIKITFAAKI